MENTYYIYHIPTIKIGVSTEPEVRVSRQGFFDYEILEQHTCVYKVSDREQELQKQYGYKVDKVPYWKTLNNTTFESRSKGGKTSGKLAKESGQLSKIHSLGGKVSGKILGNKNKESGHLSKIAHLGGMVSGKLPKYSQRKLDYQTAEYIRAQYARKRDVFGKPISINRIAKVFDVSYGTIHQILTNKTYTTP